MDFSAIIQAISTFLTILLTFITTLTSGLANIDIQPYTPTTAPAYTTPVVTTPVVPGSVITTENSGTKEPGTFTITAYGWGHGVGLSQEGAIILANSGSTYVQILQHYYSGSLVFADSSTPSTITYGGKSYSTLEFLCKTVMAEIGSSAPEAAIKAQASAIYTFAKFYNYSVKTSQIAMKSNYNYSGTNLEKIIMSYLDMNTILDAPKAKYVAVAGKPCLTVFGASAAGHTTDSESVWGTYYSYLIPVTTPESVVGKAVTIPCEEMEKYIYGYNPKLTLSGDPSNWVVILSHDESVSSSLGYVTAINVGGEKMTGYKFNYKVLNYKLRSHCFTIEYTS